MRGFEKAELKGRVEFFQLQHREFLVRPRVSLQRKNNPLPLDYH